MLKQYCPECGNPTNYSLNKPKFCSSCGLNFDTKKNLNSKLNVVANKIEKINLSDREETFDHDNDSEHYEDDIKQLDFDISKINVKNLNIEYSRDNPDILKVGDLIGTSSEGNSLRKTKFKKEKVTKKQFLEDFKKEAGTLRQKNG
jgi:hypothetical protein